MYNLYLAEKNCSTVSTLLADLNALVAGLVSGITITFSLSTNLTTPYRLLITFTGTVTSFAMIDTNLSKFILGFRGATDTLVSNIYSAKSSNYNLNADSYFLLYILSLNSMNANMSNGCFATYKIPMTSFNNSVQYYFSSSTFEQFVQITDTNLILSSLTCYILDRYGNNLQPNGLDWSMTLQVDYNI